MSREEYWTRIDAAELRSSKRRYEQAQSILDERVANNALQKGSDDESTFSILVPDQLIDFTYIEGLLLGDENARPTDSQLLIKQIYADAPESEERQAKESNLSKFRQIAMEMYSEEKEEEYEH